MARPKPVRFIIAQESETKVEFIVKPIVYVAALTYRRPDDVREMLRGLAALDLPKGWEVRFLIVDNDQDGTAEAAVREAESAFGGTLHYVMETEVGIPAARNRALREGIKSGATSLCFIDDDETPAVDWLTELLAHRLASGAVLIGGPLRRTLSGKPRSPIHRLFAHSLVARRRLAERRAAVRAAQGKPVPVYTSNWMCDLAVVSEHGILFDEAMRFSGGSDAAFYRAALSRGLAISWCPSAIVCEPISQERLSIRYQYRRSRDQGIVMAGLTRTSPLRTLATQLPRAAAGVGLLFIPLLGLASFSSGLHLIASATGHFAYLRGRQSALYARRTVSAQ